jgi:outer membrane receptor protein involved in Fe transport
VRAPNIFELFSPQTRTIYNLDIDPCDATEIAALTDPVVQANRTANCAADPLVGAGFENPLTSNFPGVTGGNPDLIEETSDTKTAGVVIQPRFLDGLTITADWWQIEIEDAIQTVQDQDVLRGCYDGPSLDPTFCSLFTRISDPGSAFFGGLNHLETGQVNFASLETQGVDFEITYTMDFIGGLLALRLNGTWLDELEEFRSSLNPEEGDIETREMRLPEWAANFGARWSNDRFTADYRARYIGNQYHRDIEENLADSFDNATTGVLWVHDISGDYQINETFTAYGGVQNFTDEKPFDTQPSYPTGPRGRYWYFGVTARLGAAAL